MIRSFFILPLFLLALATTAGAATVRAVVDRDAIVAGETLHLQIIVEDGVGTPDLSGVTGFKATFRGMNRKFQMINNRTIRQAIHNYTLIPLKNGKLTLPAIPVGLDGTVHYTLPIAIRVSEKKPVDSDQQDIYVTAAISDTTVRVGQTFTYTFRLFTATRIAKAQFEPPDFDGFLAERQGDRKSYRTMINGRKFTAIEIIFILVPTAAGTPTLAPATVEASVASRSRRSGRSGDPVVGRNEISTRILRTEPISVEVRPLPEPPAGSNFSGLVGEFEITAALDKTDVQVGDSALLTVTIQGRGDIRGAGAPEISIPSAFKAYPDAPKTARHKNAAGYSGSKVFRTALVPVTPGDYRIEPVTLTWFDTKADDYRSQATSPLEIRVTPSPGGTGPAHALTDASADALTGTPPSPRKRVEFTGRDIFPLKTGPDVLASQRALSFTGFLLLMVLPAVIFLGVRLALKQMRKDDTPARIMEKRAKKALVLAGSPGTPDAEFLSALYRAIISALLGKRGLVGTALTWAEVRGHLTELGWPAEDAASAAKLVEAVESFNYSGKILDPEKRRVFLDQTRQVVRRLMR